MDFLFPYALLGLAAVGGLVAAYLLRARFRRKPVSALFLWSSVAPATGAGRRRDRLRTPPPFFLELAALVCLALAAASPFVRRGAPPAPTLVLDDSASMSARDPAGATPATRAAAELPRLLHDAPFVRVVLASHPAPQSLGLLPRAEALALLRDPARFATPGDSLDSAVALAERLRSGDGAILVVTDRAPVRPLPPGSRHLAFGRPLPNAALSARRALASDGSESLLLSLRRFPDSTEPLRVSVEGLDGLDGSDGSDGPGTPSTLSTSFNLSTAEAKAVPLPPHCPTLRVSIPEDALALDNEAILPTAVPPPVPVLFDLSDPALLSLARRAVEATGLADLAGAEPGHQDSTSVASPEVGSGAGRTPARPVLHTDSPERLRAHRGPALLLVSASGTRTLAGPWLRDPVDPLLEGVDFTGLAWPLPAEPGASPIPGRPLLYCADAPILTVLAGADIQSAPSSIPHSAFGIQHYAFLAPPATSPFFRSTAWPSLVYNLLSLATPSTASTLSTPSTSARSAQLYPLPFTLSTFSESDLSTCATLSLSGPPLPPSEDSGDLRPLALFFGLAAFVLILLRLAIQKR